MAGPNMELFRFGLYVWARNILKPDICFSRLGSWCTLVTRSGTTNTYSQYVAPCAPLTSQIRGRFEPPETDFVRKLLPGSLQRHPRNSEELHTILHDHRSGVTQNPEIKHTLAEWRNTDRERLI